MALREIIIIPDKRLRLVSQAVKAIDREIKGLVGDMFETMYDAPGIGLAAIQVAMPKRIVTLDLSEPIALDMVKGGNVAGIVADEAYELGRAMAAVGARAVLGVENPPFIVAPALSVTKETVAEGWQKSLHKDAPQSVLDALK